MSLSPEGERGAEEEDMGGGEMKGSPTSTSRREERGGGGMRKKDQQSSPKSFTEDLFLTSLLCAILYVSGRENIQLCQNDLKTNLGF